MPKATFVISDETLEEFKKLAKKRYGDKRGVLSIAIEEAIKDWIKKIKKGTGKCRVKPSNSLLNSS